MKSERTKPYGFTIVELLIVIVVIAILASITVVAFSGLQQRARASAWVSAVDGWSKLIRMYQIQNGSWPDTAGYPKCLGDGFTATGGFAANQCYRSVPVEFLFANNDSALNAAIASSGGSVSSGVLPTVSTVDPANGNRQGHVRGLTYVYAAGGTTEPYIEYYSGKSTGSNGCIGGDSVEYAGYADDAVRCRRILR